MLTKGSFKFPVTSIRTAERMAKAAETTGVRSRNGGGPENGEFMVNYTMTRQGIRCTGITVYTRRAMNVMAMLVADEVFTE